MPQFATFTIGGNLFGLNVLLVREVNRLLDITPVDRAPEHVAGLLNLRGQIVTILDLGVRLGLGKRVRTDASRCVILKTNEEIKRGLAEEQLHESTCADIVGLLVDSVGDMVTLADSQLEPAPANIGGVEAKYIAHIARLEHVLLAALKIEAVLALQ